MADGVAFMVMPFGKKATGVSGESAPQTVDFDRLWHRVHKPVLEELGYQAVRADCDVGAFVIAEMIQRLAVADLVLADLSLANVNVYYEVGVRQAARELGCVLVAADWAEPLFDLRQMRRLQYPLADGTIGNRAAAKAQKRLLADLEPLAEGRSPVFVAVPGYPGAIDYSKLPVFQDIADTLSGFDAEVEAIRETPQAERGDRTRQMLASYGAKRVVRESAVLELLRLVRDNLDWSDVVAYIDKLPAWLRRHPLVTEQRLLARGKQGDAAGAAGALSELIERLGATSERQGLLGGRYKQLMGQTRDPVEHQRYLNRAIEAYEYGMMLDLNDYYPASNLPRLYRLRGQEGDEHKAVLAATVTVAACQRSITLGKNDEWARQTLLGAAFDIGDAEEAVRLLPDIRNEGPAKWQLKATLHDLAVSLQLQQDPEVRARLSEVLESLRELVPGTR
jgi:hypothetical protein